MSDEPHTITGMAKIFGVEAHRIRYILDSRGIKPASWAGNVAIYDTSALNQISTSIRAIQNRGGGRRHASSREMRVLQSYETR